MAIEAVAYRKLFPLTYFLGKKALFEFRTTPSFPICKNLVRGTGLVRKLQINQKPDIFFAGAINIVVGCS